MRGVALTAVFTVLGAAGCAGFPTTPRPVQDKDYVVEIRANDAQQRFDLVLVSRAAAPICLLPEVWPNSHGWLDHQGEPTVWVETEGRRLPFPQNNGGYCPGCVAATVWPGRSVSAFIPYERFEGLETSPPESRRLHFDPAATWCR